VRLLINLPMFITALKYFGTLLTVLHNTMESMNVLHLKCSQFHLNTFLLPHVHFYCFSYLCWCRKKYIKVFCWLSTVDDHSLHTFTHNIQRRCCNIKKEKCNLLLLVLSVKTERIINISYLSVCSNGLY
jgi:hypothetical protein